MQYAPFNEYFEHDLDFDWTPHLQRLLSLGLDPGKSGSAVREFPRGGSEDAVGQYSHQILLDTEHLQERAAYAISLPTFFNGISLLAMLTMSNMVQRHGNSETSLKSLVILMDWY